MHWRPAIAAVGRRGAAQLAIGAHAEEQIAGDCVCLFEKYTAAVLVIVESQRSLIEFRADLLQLLGRLFGRRRSAFNALVQQWQKPTAANLLVRPSGWPDHPQRAVTVAKGDRLLPLDGRRLMLKRAVFERARLRACPAGVIPDQYRALSLGQLLSQYLKQLLLINLAVLQASVEAGPLTAKDRHAREYRKRR